MGARRTGVLLVGLALTLSLATAAAAQPLSGPEYIPLAIPSGRSTRGSRERPSWRTAHHHPDRRDDHRRGCLWRPPTAVGAALNFTITQAQGPGHMAAWPNGPLPATSAVNFGLGEDVGNDVDIGLGTNGTVLVQSIVVTHLVVDIYGYFTDVEELGNDNTALGAGALAATPRAPETPPSAPAPSAATRATSTPPRPPAPSRQQQHGRRQHRHGVPPPSSTTPRA